jgi:hypothetical protein
VADPSTLAQIEGTALPDDEVGDWRDRRMWEGRGVPPAEQLAVLNNRMDRIEEGIKAIRVEAKEGREELRLDVRSRLDDLKSAKADAYRITNLETALASTSAELRLIIGTKADAHLVRVLAAVVFGFVGIILTAVAYNLLEARPSVGHASTADHSGSDGK